EATEIGDQSVDLRGAFLPPGSDGRIQRIGRRQAADLLRRAEPGCKVNADTVWTEHVGQRPDLLEPGAGQDQGVRVDVREHGAVDADRRVRARVVRVPGGQYLRKHRPLPKREAGVAALD